jgi:hypothetical protein
MVSEFQYIILVLRRFGPKLYSTSSTVQLLKFLRVTFDTPA